MVIMVNAKLQDDLGVDKGEWSMEQLRSSTHDSLLWKYMAYKFLRPNKITGEESN
jgi:hypothetical protein